ncbi:hypothetical protein [Enterobacter ludwigii]
MSTDSQKMQISSVEAVVFDEDNLANECRIRDYYAVNLGYFRPEEKLARCEQRYPNSLLRADMRTVNPQNTIREWEFKINADYKALGQILQYIALARENENSRVIRGVIAAFTFTPELRLANERMNLNLELVLLPTWMRGAGALPLKPAPLLGTRIPNLNLD